MVVAASVLSLSTLLLGTDPVRTAMHAQSRAEQLVG
jgi:hypothetical protein